MVAQLASAPRTSAHDRQLLADRRAVGVTRDPAARERLASLEHERLDLARRHRESQGDLVVGLRAQLREDQRSTLVVGQPLQVDEQGAQILALLGDSVTTDHISPAGSIPKDSPAGEYLILNDVAPRDFNSYGARRGNHEVMVRGTFGNIRLRNQLVPGKEGDWTAHQPDGEVMRIFVASNRYQEEGVPLVVIAGQEYGTGSSRDWAAKGTLLLGVKAVLAQSYERIHRSNLVGMGVLPLQFRQGEGAASLGLDGTEEYDIVGIGDGITPGEELEVVARKQDGAKARFRARARLDTPLEVEYYRHGGILPYVLRQLMAA